MQEGRSRAVQRQRARGAAGAHPLLLRAVFPQRIVLLKAALLLYRRVSFSSHISINSESPWRQPLHPSDICFT